MPTTSFLSFVSSGPVRFDEQIYIPARPQIPFLPEFLIVPERFVEWELSGFHIGNRESLLATATPITMDPFIVRMDEVTETKLLEISRVLDEGREVQFKFEFTVLKRPEWAMPRLMLPAIQVGQDISIGVRNPTDREMQFRAILMGRTHNYY